MAEFKEMRRKGVKVKGYWFKLRAKQLPTERGSENSFKCMCTSDNVNDKKCGTLNLVLALLGLNWP